MWRLGLSAKLPKVDSCTAANSTPAIAVIKHRRGCYEIFDGYHRFHAHRLEGRKTIAVWLTVS